VTLEDGEEPRSTNLQNSSERKSNLDLAFMEIRHEVIHSGEEIAAWKLGGTTWQSRQELKTTELIFGPLLSRQIISSGTVPEPLVQDCVELEISIRQSREAEGYEWCLTLEFPFLPNPKVQPVTTEFLVRNRCGAGAMYVGAPKPLSLLDDFNYKNIELIISDKDAVTADLKRLVVSPLATYENFLETAFQHGFSPSPRDWVATGGITTCVDFSMGDRLEVWVDGGLELSTRVQGID